LDERGRRLFAGVVAACMAAMYAETASGKKKKSEEIDRWGIKRAYDITRLWPATIKKGLGELQSWDYRELADAGRTRREGGGRKPSRPPDSGA
jgi:hypothetical protein